ncbi:MAG: DUF3352 domain-containing protein [Gemmatimonadota bacterium]
MRRFAFSLRLGSLLLLGLALLACKRDRDGDGSAPAGYRTQAVATTLPAGASVVISGFDIEGFWTRLRSTKLYTELKAIPGVQQAFAPLAASRREFEAETGLPLNEATLMSLFGRKFDLGYYGPLAGDRGDLLLVASIEDEGDARKILQSLEKKVTAEQGTTGPTTFREERIGGAATRVAKNGEGQDVLFYTLAGGHLTMATTRPRLEAALGLAGGGDVDAMPSVAGYADVVKKLPEVALAVYVDQRALQQAAAQAGEADSAAATPEEQLQRERMRAATAALETYKLASAIAMGAFWDEAGIRGVVYTRLPDGPRSPLAEMLTQSPAPIRSLVFQPESTLLYSALGSLDAETIYAALYRYAVDATRIQLGVKSTPDSLRGNAEVAQQLAAFEAANGLNIREDLISWVGNEVAISIAGVEKSGFFPLPELAVTISTTDAGRSRALLAKLEARVADVARMRASIPLTWQSEEYEGQTIRFAPTPLGEGLSLAHLTTKEFVVIASNRALARRMLDASAGRAEALPSNAGFSAMTEFYPNEVNALGFVNIEQILTVVQDLMGTYGQMTGSAAVADSASTTGQVLRALKNAPRLGFYSEADADGVFGQFLLEIR